MSMGKAPPCNKDCEHCPFPDCVWDGLDHEDYKELAALDKDLTRTPEQKKLAAQQRAYNLGFDDGDRAYSAAVLSTREEIMHKAGVVFL